MRRWLLFLALSVSGAGLAWAQLVRMPLLTAPPYGMVDSQGQMAGLYPDVARALAREAGLQVQIELVPFARAANEVAKGGGDATIMMSTAFSENKAVEAVVVFYTRQILLVRPGLKVAASAGLSQLTIGRLNGGCQSLADQQSETIKFQEINSQSSGVGMLALGRIDAFCSTEEAVRAEIRSQGMEARLHNAQVIELGARPVWLMLAPKLTPPVGQALVEAVKRMQKSGELLKIFRSHLGSAYQLQTQEKVPAGKHVPVANRPQTQ